MDLKGPGFYLAYLYLIRVPILVAVFILCLSLAALSPDVPVIGSETAYSMVHGLFDLNDVEVVLLGSVLPFVWLTLALASVAVVSYAPSRFGLEMRSEDEDARIAVISIRPRRILVPTSPKIDLPKRLEFAIPVLLFPLGFFYLVCLFCLACVVAIVGFEDHSYRGLLIFILPAFMIFLTEAGANARFHIRRGSMIRLEAFQPAQRTHNWTEYILRLPMTAVRRIARLSPHGFLSADQKDGELRLGHIALTYTASLFFLIYLVPICLKAHELAGSKEIPVGQPGYASLATVYGLLFLLIVICFVFTGITFFLDRFRFPFIAFVMAFTYVWWWPGYADQFYRVQAAARTQGPLPAEIAKAIAGTKQGSVIVVCANGGGIQAAAWTAKVLTELDSATNGLFSKHVGAISAVSGGSVGAMFYVQAFDKGALQEGQRSQVFERSAKSSLDEVTWGLIGPDLARELTPWWFQESGRGWALERSWERRGMGNPTLRSWREDLRNGDRPAIMFNSTAVETGERMVLSNFDFHLDPRERDSRDRKAPRSFNEIYPEWDVLVSTAARLSAAFPVVTPVARPSADVGSERSLHLADGGYYDNFGIASMVNFLEQALLSNQETGVKRVLLVEIRCRRIVDPETAHGGHGWWFQAGAPFTALMSVRESAQVSRNRTDIGLLRRALNQNGIEFRSVVFENQRRSVPLSWHLTSREVAGLGDDWNEYFTRQSRCEVEAVIDFLNGKNPRTACGQDSCPSRLWDKSISSVPCGPG